MSSGEDDDTYTKALKKSGCQEEHFALIVMGALLCWCSPDRTATTSTMTGASARPSARPSSFAWKSTKHHQQMEAINYPRAKAAVRAGIRRQGRPSCGCAWQARRPGRSLPPRPRRTTAPRQTAPLRWEGAPEFVYCSLRCIFLTKNTQPAVMHHVGLT